MHETYEKLLQIKRNSRYDYFAMAVAYFFDIGYAQAKKISDEDIKNVKGNSFMTKEFNEWLMTTARQIADATESAIELVQFCMAEDMFELRYFAGKLGRGELEDMIKTRITYEDRYPTGNKYPTNPAAADYFEGHYGCDIEDFRYLGYDIPGDNNEAAI